MRVTPLSAALGATVEELDPDKLDALTAQGLRQALWDHQVLIFPRLKLDDEQHLALGRVFGELEPHRIEGEDHRAQKSVDGRPEILVLDDANAQPANFWHTDATFRSAPPLGSLLSMQTSPASGGDTMWASTYAAYEALAEPMRELVDGLTAVHGHPPMTQTSEHPVVGVHPETGRRALYVNRGWTRGIKGLSRVESSGLLGLLCDVAERPEHTVRWSWSDGDAAIWDNRCTMHYALFDYGSDYRRIHRITIAGTAPASIARSPA